MTKTRLEAFSDGVIAILITIMVLELRPPEEPTWSAVVDSHLIGALVMYALSFVFLGIYWTNHHHMFHAVRHTNGAMLWANLHLLFWLSLVPFGTEWVGRTHFGSLPTAAYGVMLLMASVAWMILRNTIIAFQGPDSPLKAALGRDAKAAVSTVLYALAIPLAFVRPMISVGCYAVVAGLWLVPDRRIETRLGTEEH